MSYARFGADGSDVYVFHHAGGFIECCACPMNPPGEPDTLFGLAFPLSWHTPTTGPRFDPDNPGQGLPRAAYDEMIEHLRLHVTAGQHVPEDVFTELRHDRDTEGT